MSKKIYVCTTNENKINEIKVYFETHNLNYQILKSPIDLSLIVENGDTFYENAKIKALYLSEHIDCDGLILADDSGLCIDALNGFPGINSARFCVDNKYDYETKNNYILSLMNFCKNKTAHFVCSLVLIDENKRIWNFESKCTGVIKKNFSSFNKGFGYDPIFYSKEANKFFSDMTKEEKNLYSHRGKALNLLANFLKQYQ